MSSTGSPTFAPPEPPRFRSLAAEPEGMAPPEVPLSARFPGFLHMPAGGLEMLSQLGVLLVGTGSIGLPVADFLGRLRILLAYLVDPSRFKPESLLTHPIEPSDVGRFKAEFAGRRIKRLSPATEVRVLVGSIADVHAHDVRQAGLVVVCTDNLHAEVHASAIARHLGVPLLQLSVHGGTMSIQVRQVLNREAEGPCLVCQYTAAEWAALNNQLVYTCQGNGGVRARLSRVVPTMSVPPLCGLAAGLGGVALIKLAAGLEVPQSDHLLTYNGYSMKSIETPLVRSPSCPCDHDPLTFHRLNTPLADRTPLELLEAAGESRQRSGHATLELENRAFVQAISCCGDIVELNRFVVVGEPAGQCSRCGREVSAQPFFTQKQVSFTSLAAAIGEPLALRGAGAARWGVIRSRGKSHLLHFEEAS